MLEAVCGSQPATNDPLSFCWFHLLFSDRHSVGYMLHQTNSTSYNCKHAIFSQYNHWKTNHTLLRPNNVLFNRTSIGLNAAFLLTLIWKYGYWLGSFSIQSVAINYHCFHRQISEIMLNWNKIKVATFKSLRVSACVVDSFQPILLSAVYLIHVLNILTFWH